VLFDASATYAPGEPRGDVPYGTYQSTDVLGRYHLDQLKPYSLWIGVGGLLLLAYLVHKYGGKRR